jgi:hypothetical protein
MRKPYKLMVHLYQNRKVNDLKTCCGRYSKDGLLKTTLEFPLTVTCKTCIKTKEYKRRIAEDMAERMMEV